MTVAVAPSADNSSVRRSSRVSKKRAHYEEVSGSEDENQSEEEAYEERPKKNKKPHRNSKSNKRRSINGSKKTLEQLEAELPENYLYKSLSFEDLDVKDLALEWIESYEEENGSHESLTILINLILRSCGSVHLFQPHDLANLESAIQTVGELTIAFSDQQSHKYPFKALTSFRRNVLEFFEELIQVSHDRGLLYKAADHNNKNAAGDEADDSFLSSQMMSEILTWISSLSSCPIRPLRYVSTVILLTIQNRLCVIINSVITSLDKAQRQLSKIKRIASNKLKIENLNKTTLMYHNQKDTITEYFGEIGNITLMHRYRDIDSSIRQECVKNLSVAMITYPDFFFQATFLRYFGWLLSDPSVQVRSEVTKVLSKLYKNANNNNSTLGMGFRQFTERYKKQIIKMSLMDIDVSVRLSAISICCELLRIGFLEENDSLEIISNFFLLFENRTNLSNTNVEKLKLELSKFVCIANLENTRDELEKHSLFLETYESDLFGDNDVCLDLKECLRIKNLIRLLQSSLSYFCNGRPSAQLKYPISIIFASLYQTPTYSGSWETLIRFYLIDMSSVTFRKKNEKSNDTNAEVIAFKALLDFSTDEEKTYLLELIYGALSSIYSRTSNKPKDLEDLSSILVKLVDYLPSLLSSLVTSKIQFSVFVQIFNSVIESNDEKKNIYPVFMNMDRQNSYNDLVHSLLLYFRDYDVTDINSDPFLEGFERFLERLLTHYNSVSINSTYLNIIDSEIRLDVQNLIQDLVEQVRGLLIGNEHSETRPLGQEDLLKVVISISKPIMKLRMIGDHCNINQYLEGSNPSFSLCEQIIVKSFNELDIQFLVENSPNQFLDLVDDGILSFKAILDLILVSISWKLEQLIYVPNTEGNDQESRFDISLIFSDADMIIGQLWRFISSINDAVNGINENFGTSATISCNVGILMKKCNNMRTLFAAKFIDIITCLKIFYTKFNGNNQFKNFDNFFAGSSEIGNLVVHMLPSSVQEELLNIFLLKEAKLAKFLDVELEKGNDENVNLEDLAETENIEEEPQKSFFDSEDEAMSDEDEEEKLARQKAKEDEARSRKSEGIWKAEKDLCVYSLKFFGLVDLSMVRTEVYDRIKLNSDKLGILYKKIVTQNDEQLKSQESHPESASR